LRLLDPSVARSLAGQGVSWSQEADTAVVRNTVAAPVVLDGEIAGAIVLQSSSDGLLLATNRAVARLVLTTLALALGLTAGLWYFASRLSRRVRRLSGAVSRAMEERSTRIAAAAAGPRRVGRLARNNASCCARLPITAGTCRRWPANCRTNSRHRWPSRVPRWTTSQPGPGPFRAAFCSAPRGVARQTAIVRAMSEASRLEAAIARRTGSG
jgi:hypothetical protein